MKLNALTLGFKCSSSNKTQVFFSWLALLEHNIIICFVEGVHVSADLRTKDEAATTLCWIV